MGQGSFMLTCTVGFVMLGVALCHPELNEVEPKNLLRRFWFSCHRYAISPSPTRQVRRSPSLQSLISSLPSPIPCLKFLIYSFVLIQKNQKIKTWKLS